MVEFEGEKKVDFMDPRKARELAAGIMKCGENRIYISPDGLTKVAEAMTKDDMRQLIAERVVKKRAAVDQSRGRARILKAQRLKGRRRGQGKRTGTKKVRGEQRNTWINKVRSQRAMLKELRKTNPAAVEAKGYGKTYRRIKGNYFKGKNYVKEYIEGGEAK